MMKRSNLYTQRCEVVLSSVVLGLLIALSLPKQTLAIRRLPDFTQSSIKNAIVNKVMLSDGYDDNATRRKLGNSNYEDEDELLRHRDLKEVTLPAAEDHLVTSLPYLDPSIFPTKHYAGHMPASHDDDKKLFYWLFEPDFSDGRPENDADIPLLIWLNGGPGCSSMDGLWLENGPFRLIPPRDHNDDWEIKINPYSWHAAPAYTLYIDQPVGTGLSFTKKKNYCKTDEQIDIDFHLFLENFMLVHEEKFLIPPEGGEEEGQTDTQRKMSRPLYFSGESHAGHYIPSMMDHILKRNDDENSNSKPRVLMNLAGAAIGNGWTDPVYQYAAAEAAYGIGMIDLAQKEALDKEEEICQEQLRKGKFTSKQCDNLLNKVISGSHGISGKTKVSVYDNRKWESKSGERDFPPGHKNVEAYLGGWQNGAGYPDNMKVNYKDVLKAIHADESVAAKQRYEECTDPPYFALSGQDGKGVVNEVVTILEHGSKPRLLFFNGVNDFICNHVGNERMLMNLPWSHKNEWNLSKRYVWDAFPGAEEPAGYMKEYSNLSFLKVMASGHMVPMDVPDVALEMIRTFMHHGSFESSNQNINGLILEGPGECNCNTQGNDDDGEEEEQTRRNLIAGQGVIGAAFGVMFTFFYNHVRGRGRLSKSLKRSVDGDDMTSLTSDEPYTDHPGMEMEMVKC